MMGALENLLGDDPSLRRKLAVNTLILLICWLAVIGLGTLVAAAFYYLTH